jgi:hypothetical protein
VWQRFGDSAYLSAFAGLRCNGDRHLRCNRAIPAIFTADFRIGEDFNVGSKHAVRISLTIRNLTNHTNPLQVHNNSGDPLYGTFFGGYGRHFIPDFDFLF